MKSFFSSLSQSTKEPKKETYFEIKNDDKTNLIKTKKEKRKLKKEAILNFVILEDDENYSDIEENKINSDEKDLSYFEKQNLFFKSTRNMAKKIPYKIAFTQEIDFQNNKISKSLSSIETKDYDKIVPKNKKGIELIPNKEKIDDLFIEYDED